MSNSSITLMTDGPVSKRIIAFAIPLFWGNLFQQLYNTADSLIVGNFLGNEALAAVSSSSHLIFLMVGFFNGVSIGAGVVVGKFFGSKEYDKLHQSIHTIVAFGLICGVLLTIVGTLGTPWILRLMGTPLDVLPKSITYFQIYYMGSLAFVMYNFFVGILQAIGDSRHPLIYLVVSSIINVILDLLFIAVLGFDVGAAALATVISQFISALLCMYRLMKNPPEFRLYLRDIRIDSFYLKQAVNNGLPAGMQNSIISVANIFVQSNINKFGKMAMAGCGTYAKIQGFAFLPITCFSLALTTFISQNLGAREYDRAKHGVIFGVLCGITVSELIGVIIYFFIPKMIYAFSTTPAIISYGSANARTDCLFYFLLAFSHCMAGIFRGAGKSHVPMYVMLLCWCIIRVTFISIMIRMIPSIQVIFWTYPLTWLLSSICFIIYYKKSDWIHGLEDLKTES